MAGGAVNCNTGYFDGAKIGKVHKKALWIAAAAYFFDQMSLMMFGFIAPVIQESWSLSMEQLATMNSLSFWGMCVGGIFGGWLADKVGRKNAMLGCIAIFSISSLIAGFTNNILLFTFTRFTTGFGVIGMTVIAMVYMAEMMPSETRGKYQALTIACGTAGIPVGTLFSSWVIPLSPESWRMVFYFCGMGIVLVPIGMAWLKESPRWLVSKGRVQDAEKVVFECIGRKVDLSSQVAQCNNKGVSVFGACKIMFSPAFRQRTLVVGILVIGVTLGIFYLQSWGTTLLVDMGWMLNTILMLSALTTFGSPIGDFLCSFFTDKGGRKMPIIIFCGILFFCRAAQGWFVDSIVVYGVFTFLGTVFGAGAMSMLYTYLAESFPTSIRSNATGIIFSAARASTALVMFTVPIFYESFGFFGLNVINGLMFLIPAIIAFFFGESTAQKSLEELEADAMAATR